MLNILNSFHNQTRNLSIIIHTGRQMLNFCAPVKCCGAYHLIWTDEEVPADVFSLAAINTFAVDFDESKEFTHEVQVMRCSVDTEYDLIYKHIGEYKNNNAFCDMN